MLSVSVYNLLIEIKYCILKCLIADQYIRVYDTTNDGFRHIKSIQARDVGWSILDTAFR